MADATKKAHCHLFAILARKANKAVILRRGPSDWVRLISWDTEHDTFELGQWFHGRIYERRCDLSPDGSKLIYFARKKNRRTLLPEICFTKERFPGYAPS